MATATANRAQQIIDLYFPTGRPSDYGDWRSQWATANLLDPTGRSGRRRNEQRPRADLGNGSHGTPCPENPINFNSGLKSGSFTYTRRNRALTGLNYTVWTSPNLSDWTEDTGAQQTPGAPDGNGVQTVEVVLSPGLLEIRPSSSGCARASDHAARGWGLGR